jgi:hypothetical protein
MRIAAVVSDLQDDAAAACVDSLGDCSPSGDLFLGINSWSAGIAVGLRSDRGSFGNDEASRGTLRVIFNVQCGGRMAFSGAHSRERGHDNSIWEANSSKLQRSEKRFEGHCWPFLQRSVYEKCAGKERVQKKKRKIPPSKNEGGAPPVTRRVHAERATAGV